MKHKVSELTGALLDAAVADIEMSGWRELSSIPMEITTHDNGQSATPFTPSTDWSQGGPIIERERISLLVCKDGKKILWNAYHLGEDEWIPDVDGVESYGVPRDEAAETPLIAAMRAYVASKFGEEIDL